MNDDGIEDDGGGVEAGTGGVLFSFSFNTTYLSFKRDLLLILPTRHREKMFNEHWRGFIEHLNPTGAW